MSPQTSLWGLFSALWLWVLRQLGGFSLHNGVSHQSFFSMLFSWLIKGFFFFFFGEKAINELRYFKLEHSFQITINIKKFS